MEVLRSGITPATLGISNGLGASLHRCVAWLKPYRLVPKGICTEVAVGRSSTTTTNFFCGDDVTNPHRMPDGRQAVIDVQNAI